MIVGRCYNRAFYSVNNSLKALHISLPPAGPFIQTPPLLDRHTALVEFQGEMG